MRRKREKKPRQTLISAHLGGRFLLGFSFSLAFFGTFSRYSLADYTYSRFWSRHPAKSSPLVHFTERCAPENEFPGKAKQNKIIITTYKRCRAKTRQPTPYRVDAAIKRSESSESNAFAIIIAITIESKSPHSLCAETRSLTRVVLS